MTAEWKDFNWSAAVANELEKAEHGYLLLVDGRIEGTFDGPVPGKFLNNATKYLICEPLPHGEVLAAYAMTGCPVWYKQHGDAEWQKTDRPKFSSLLEYSIVPPEKKTVYWVRHWLDNKGSERVAQTKVLSTGNLERFTEKVRGFVKWVDDWQKREV